MKITAPLRLILALALMLYTACEQPQQLAATNPPPNPTTSAPLTSPPPAPTLPPAAAQPSEPLTAGPALIDVTAPEALAVIQAPGARVTLVNVWATWCSPCVEEFPYLVQLHRNYADKGLRVVLISFDAERQTKAVRQFLEKNNVTFPTYRRAGKDQPFIEGLSPSWSGALPLTLIYDGDGKLRRAWEREATYQEFEAAILKLLNPSAPTSP